MRRRRTYPAPNDQEQARHGHEQANGAGARRAQRPGGAAEGQARRKAAPALPTGRPDAARAAAAPRATAAELTAFFGRVLADVRDSRPDPAPPTPWATRPAPSRRP